MSIVTYQTYFSATMMESNGMSKTVQLNSDLLNCNIAISPFVTSEPPGAMRHEGNSVITYCGCKIRAVCEDSMLTMLPVVSLFDIVHSIGLTW